MKREVWDNLLDAARAAHMHQLELAAFCPMATDLSPIDVVPHHIPAAELMTSDATLRQSSPLGDAFLDASPSAHWRETYKGTAIADDFMERFACYCLIGQGGAFISRRMSAYVVYMPPHLDYPFHHHPAEEMYVILAGEAEFRLEGQSPERLTAGCVSQHQANQPHATTTGSKPMLAYVVWRNQLDIPPVWTDPRLYDTKGLP